MLKKAEIFLRHLLLNIFLLFSKRKSKAELHLKEGGKILIIRLNRIGDALVTTPLIKVLSEHGKFKVYVLADRKNKFVFENNPFVTETIEFRKGLAGFFQTVQYLNNLNFDLAIDTHPDVSTTVSFIIASLKNVFTVAFSKSNEKIYSATIEQPPKEKFHIIDRLLKFADFLNVKYSGKDVNVVYFLKQESLQFVEKKLADFNRKGFSPIGVNISAGSNARFWSVENYRKLLNLLSFFNVTPIVLCSPSDKEKATIIAQNNYPVFYTDNFNVFAAMISKLKFLFTPDTSVVHLASAFEIPMFGIYVKYDTTEKEWFPYRSDYEIVITEEPNLDNLGFNEVKEKLVPFLNKYFNEKKETIEDKI